MARRDGAFTFTFSRRNQDVREFIEQKAIDDIGFVRTDYFCEAVRFYEKHKNNLNLSSEEIIKNLIMDTLKTMNIEGNQAETITNKINVNTKLNDLDDMDDEFLDED